MRSNVSICANGKPATSEMRMKITSQAFDLKRTGSENSATVHFQEWLEIQHIRKQYVSLNVIRICLFEKQWIRLQWDYMATLC